MAKEHAALLSFAKDPAQFVHLLARSNARDAQFLKACEALDSENPLEMQPYLEDSVSQYLLAKRLKSEETNKKK